MQFCYGFATVTSAWPAEQPPFKFLRCFSRFHDLTETSGPYTNSGIGFRSNDNPIRGKTLEF
jgi:hypothetical protein